jgi:DNA polymerase-1
LNRAFYGVKYLSTKDGMPTNAVFGFLNIMFKYIEIEKPDGICAAFDLKGPTFRHEFYDEYKATRKGMPDDLAVQLEPVKKILRALSYPVYEMKGYEADDIIGTFSKECSKLGHECIILTGDKDDLQLASENTRIRLIRTIMGKTHDDDFTPEKVFEVYGMTPLQFIDLKSIMGDTSDNIPGVPGIGEKGASMLIQKFGSLDGVYANLENPDIKPAMRKKLEENKKLAYDSKFLSKINCNRKS